MKKQLTKEEQLIQFFNEKFKNSKTNEVTISRNDIPKLNMSEQEASQTIHLLQEENLLRIKDKSAHNNFDKFWTIILRSSCIHYFENQKINKKTKIINFFTEFRAWITLGIAILSLIIAA